MAIGSFKSQEEPKPVGRRQPKQKVGGASPGWVLFALAAVGSAVALAYWLAIR